MTKLSSRAAIRGGADLASPSPVRRRRPPGTVLEIDRPTGTPPEQFRSLRSKVAVISSSRRVQPGIVLTQTGVLEEGPAVALSDGRMPGGRQLCAGADRGFATISPTPGHAMKAWTGTTSGALWASHVILSVGRVWCWYWRPSITANPINATLICHEIIFRDTARWPGSVARPGGVWSSPHSLPAVSLTDFGYDKMKRAPPPMQTFFPNTPPRLLRTDQTLPNSATGSSRRAPMTSTLISKKYPTIVFSGPLPQSCT